MSAPVTRIHPHECRYVLIVGGRSICVSSCHYGKPLPIDPPGPKRRAA